MQMDPRCKRLNALSDQYHQLFRHMAEKYLEQACLERKYKEKLCLGDFLLLYEVGEGGNRLSIGQKQLISFARALLNDPAIFVLDEATSSVDTETEQMIQHAIATTLSGRTSFIIAHRLSTVRSADRILLIRDGKIAESGTHRELIALGGEYCRLYSNQFTDEAGRALLGYAPREETEEGS